MTFSAFRAHVYGLPQIHSTASRQGWQELRRSRWIVTLPLHLPATAHGLVSYLRFPAPLLPESKANHCWRNAPGVPASEWKGHGEYQFMPCDRRVKITRYRQPVTVADSSFVPQTIPVARLLFLSHDSGLAVSMLAIFSFSVRIDTPHFLSNFSYLLFHLLGIKLELLD